MFHPLAAVEFCVGRVLVAVTEESPYGWIPVSQVCELLGAKLQPQIELLRREPWSDIKVVAVPCLDGRIRELDCVPMDKLPLWLVNIKERQLSHAKRSLLGKFQCESMDSNKWRFEDQPTWADITFSARPLPMPCC